MRKEERKYVSRPAKIELPGGRLEACRIANASHEGMLLVVLDSEWLPKSFIVHDIFSEARWPVEVMWTLPNRAGVRFTDPAARTLLKNRPFEFAKHI